MASPIELMKKELSTWVVPILKTKGFKGSLSHFRRITGSKVDLLSFQFDKWGGAFVLNLAIGPATGFTTYWGKFVPANKLNPSYDLGTKTRIQPGQDGSTDSWFRFDRPSSNPAENVYETTAKEMIPFLDKAEEWFAQFDSWTKPDRPVVSPEKALEHKQLHIVAIGIAKNSSEQQVIEELAEAGTPTEEAPRIYREIIDRLERKQKHKPWWKFW